MAPFSLTQKKLLEEVHGRPYGLDFQTQAKQINDMAKALEKFGLGQEQSFYEFCKAAIKNTNSVIREAMDRDFWHREIENHVGFDIEEEVNLDLLASQNGADMMKVLPKLNKYKCSGPQLHHHFLQHDTRSSYHESFSSIDWSCESLSDCIANTVISQSSSGIDCSCW